MLCYQCKAERADSAEPCASCGAVPDHFLGRVLQGKFEIRKRLGQGGFGAVYEAYHKELESKVAVKTLHAGLTGSSQAVERFKREALATSKLQSPHVVKIFDRGNTQDGILWLAMEFVQGETLNDRIKRQGHLSEKEFLELFGPICEALQEAHSKGIIHRDLKPDNIMLTTLESGKPFPKILDFGIATLRTQDGSLTQSGSISGTPKYMSPEQWEGLKKTDARSDIYSLGIIAYQCLSGELPFMAESTFGWMNLHYNKPPAPLRETMKGRPLSKHIEAAVMKSIAKAPQERFSTTLEFFQVLSGEAPAPKLVRAPLAPGSSATPFGEAHTADLAHTLQDSKRQANATMGELSLQGSSIASVSGTLDKKEPARFWQWAVGIFGLAASLGGVVYFTQPTPAQPEANLVSNTQPTSTSKPKSQEVKPGTAPITVQAITAVELAAKEEWALAADLEKEEAIKEKYRLEAENKKKLGLCESKEDMKAAIEACAQIPPGSGYYQRAQAIIAAATQEVKNNQEKQLTEVNRLLSKTDRKSLEDAKRLLESLMRDKEFSQQKKLSEVKKKLDQALKALPPTPEELSRQILEHKTKNELAPLCNKFRQYKAIEKDPKQVEKLQAKLDNDELDFSREKACSGLF